MGKSFRAWNPEQRYLLPPAVDEFVPRGHLAHFVRELVRESLDLAAIVDSYSGEERGYPPYDPTMMTGLLLYAYCQGVYSSRRIAQACEQRLDFMAVTALNRPDFRTISDFRKRHLKALGELFVQVLGLCRQAGLTKLGHVSLDGTKVKANASRHKAMSYGRMEQAQRRLLGEVAAWFEQAAAADAAEDSELGQARRGDELPEWVTNKLRRLEKIRAAKAALEAEAQTAASKPRPDDQEPGQGGGGSGPGVPADKAQRNFTDPDSRIMKGSEGFVQAYNAQAAVDADSHVIVAQMLTNQAADVNHLRPMLDQVSANTGSQPREFSADAGYCSEDNLAEFERRHLNAYIATGRLIHGSGNAGTDERIKGGPRRVAMWRKLRQGGLRSRYRLRKQTAEPVFGAIKHARGFRQFLLRGLHNVWAEWSLLCTAHNLLKLAATWG
jgi:transposase